MRKIQFVLLYSSIILTFNACGGCTNDFSNKTSTTERARDDYDILMDRINNEADFPHHKGYSGENILHQLSNREYTQKYTKSQIINIAKAILDKGVYVDITKDNGDTPLFTILEDTDSGNYEYNNEAVVFELAKLYISEGANVNFRSDENYYGNSALQVSAMKGHPKALKLLIDKGANVNNKDDKHGWTPLHSTIFWSDSHSVHTSRYKQIECIKILINNGALINEKAYDNEHAHGFSPLHLATNTNQKDIVKILLSNNADVNTRIKGDFTPCDYAAHYGNEDMLNLLRA